jgi:hypothetical protein
MSGKFERVHSSSRQMLPVISNHPGAGVLLQIPPSMLVGGNHAEYLDAGE